MRKLSDWLEVRDEGEQLVGNRLRGAGEIEFEKNGVRGGRC